MPMLMPSCSCASRYIIIILFALITRFARMYEKKGLNYRVMRADRRTTFPSLSGPLWRGAQAQAQACEILISRSWLAARMPGDAQRSAAVTPPGSGQPSSLQTSTSKQLPTATDAADLAGPGLG